MASSRGHLSRKMAAIVHADVAGSTALVHLDESLAHERINQAFSRFSQSIQHYGGTVHEIRGDALIAEFSRASDAVCAALAFQESHSQVLAELKDAIAPKIRIGVSLGEVIFADGQVTGAGVVLAQRVEQLAEPDGVCITGAVHETLPQHLPFDQDDLGEQEVKGFDEPVRVYRVQLKDAGTLPEPTIPSETKRTPVVQWMVVAVVVLICGGGLLAWVQPWKPDFEPALVERVAFQLPDKPSIAVLPFTNMSDNRQQDYFADGMTDDLITDLSKISGLFVIARNSSFTYKGKAVDVKNVARDLGVRYVLEGSVRRAGDQVRINAQLIDATTNGHLWAERYDGVISNVFSLQDEITAKIIAALAVQLTSDEEAAQSTKQTDSPEAYEAFLKGLEHYRRDTIEHYAKAMEYFEQATDLDPEYSRAYAAMASIYWISFIDEFYQVFQMDRTTARERAQELLELAMRRPTSLAYQASSDINLWWHRYDEAIRDGEKAIELDPNNAGGLVVLATALIFSGQPHGALDLMDKAEHIDPIGKAHYEFVRGMAYFGMEQFDKAASALERARELNPEDWAATDPENECRPCHILLSIYGHLGRTEKAQLVLAYIRSYWDRFNIQGMPQYWPYKEEIDAERFNEGLRKAGVPEFGGQ